MPSHSISETGLTLIQEFEGFRAEPTLLPDGSWVVGYGHVRIAEEGVAVTRDEAAAMLALDLAPVEIAINNVVTAEINQYEFDALVSFAFSIGMEEFEHSAVLRRVNKGESVAAACAMDAWRKSDVSGELEIIDALVRRRAAEKALYLKGATKEVSPSAFMRAKIDHAASILGAPVAYSAAPEVGSIPVRTKAAPVAIITEVLLSEPATELVLTRVATEEEIAEDEIVTAHAKPVSRRMDRSLVKTPVEKKRKFGFKFSFKPVESVGLGALMLFGAGLIALGALTLVCGNDDAIDMLGAAALIAPGLAGVFIAAFGFMRPAHQIA